MERRRLESYFLLARWTVGKAVSAKLTYTRSLGNCITVCKEWNTFHSKPFFWRNLIVSLAGYEPNWSCIEQLGMSEREFFKDLGMSSSCCISHFSRTGKEKAFSSWLLHNW